MKSKPRGLQPHAWFLTRVPRRILRSLAFFRTFNVTVINREAVPERGGVIIACNHISVFDAIFLWDAVRRNAIAMAKAELWRTPAGALMWMLGHIPVKRGNRDSGDRALKTATRVIDHGGIVFLYPEGKCSRDGKLLPFKEGVARLAFATLTPVVPAGIKGSNGVKPLGKARFNRRYPVTLAFGKALDPREYTGETALADFMAELYRRIEKLSA